MVSLRERVESSLFEENMYLTSIVSYRELNEVVIPTLVRSRWKRLWLGGNHFSDMSIYVLCQALKVCNNLTELYLENNLITHVGATILAEILPFTPITWLSLTNNNIGDNGVIALASKLSKCSLKVLYLDKTQVSDLGVFELSKNIPKSSLEAIWLNENKFTDEGVKALTNIVPRSSLLSCHIEGNNRLSARQKLELWNLLRLPNTVWYQIITTLCSVSSVPRLGKNSSFKRIPKELIRMLATTLPIKNM